MTKQLIEDALNSPSLIGELKKYHKEQGQQIARRGLLVVLSCAFLLLTYLGNSQIFQGSNNTHAPSSTVRGGLVSEQDALIEYDRKNSDLQKAASALSIERNDIKSLHQTHSSEWPHSERSIVVAWSKSPVYRLLSEEQTGISQEFLALGPESFKYYGHIIDKKSFQNSKIDLLVARSGSFALLKDSGNFLTTSFEADTCYKNPENKLSYNLCPNSNSFSSSIVASNLTYKTEAPFIKNKPGDRIEYKIKMKNTGQSEINFFPELYIGDILEYSILTNVDNAKFDKKTSTLLWPAIHLVPGSENTITFGVQVHGNTSLSPRSTTNSASLDCYISSYFGTSNNIKIACPAPKTIEKFGLLPLHPYLRHIAWFALLASILLYLRSYILGRERELLLRHMEKKHD